MVPFQQAGIEGSYIRSLKICQVQLNLTLGDLDGNTTKIIHGIQQAQQRQADIVCFSELAVTGYPPEDLVFNQTFISDNIQALDKIIKATGDVVAIVGFIDRNRGWLFNSAAVISKGKMHGSQAKKCLPNYSVFDEERYFRQATSHNLFLVRGVKVGVTICEDIWAKAGPLEDFSVAGAEVLVNLNASPYFAGKRDVRLQVLREQAQRYQVHIVYTNLVGGQDELVFDGRSLLVSPEGELLAEGHHCREDFLDGVIDVGERAPVGIPSAASAVTTVEISDKPSINTPDVEALEIAPLNTIAEDYQALVLGVKDYSQKNGFEAAVVGLSGGIDSSVTAAIAVDALGAKRVTGLSMPAAVSPSASVADAKAVAENLGIKLIELAISELLQGYLDVLSSVFQGRPPDATEENLQARIRGNLLMALSNKFGWLVLATGNKSELAIGYTTLYGDMVGGFAVIKDVFKTRLYELARYRNSQRMAIPENVLTKAPSAELRPGQRDEDDIPPYALLDKILKLYVEEDKSIDEILAAGYTQEVVSDVVKRVDDAEYKRRQGPVGVKISRKAFGRDRRLPITNHYHR